MSANEIERQMNAHSVVSASSDTGGPCPLLVDARHVQTLLCIGERQLWTLTNCGAIPSYRIGRSVRYAISEIQAWVSLGCPTEPGSAERVRKAVRS